MANYKFNAKQELECIIAHMVTHFEKSNLDNKVVIGISGGKDSSVCAAIACKAFGKENVFGVLMPNGEQKDISDSVKICELLGIKYATINIGEAYNALTKEVGLAFNQPDTEDVDNYPDPNSFERYETNTPARLRMATLYGVSAMVGGVVLNTCNLSEGIVGYSTLFGDCAGGYAPIQGYTVTEVRAMGKELGLPEWVYMKTPDDGMCGLSDESKLARELSIDGFTYERLDSWIRYSVTDAFTMEEAKRISNRMAGNKFKVELVRIPHYDPTYYNNPLR